jgi:L-lactate dehydrogenase (cytochrome)
MRLIDSYADAALSRTSLPSTAHVGYLLRTSPDWEYLRWIRDAWNGPMVVKGVLDPTDAPKLEAEGVDAIWVSNHAGRQSEAAPAPAQVLPAIRAATRLPLIADSGVEGGLDILRLIALGADFVMLGRAFHYGLGALGAEGPNHVASILEADMISNMHQIGATRLDELAKRIV